MLSSHIPRASHCPLGGFEFSLYAMSRLSRHCLLTATVAVLLCVSGAGVSAQDADDLDSTPRRLPPSAAEAPTPEGAAPEAGEVPLAPSFVDKVTIGLNQEISRLNRDSGFIPPDTMGAVGPNHIVEMINGNFEIFNKQTGASLESRSLDSFWVDRVGLTIGTTFTFDPRIVFDPDSGRWFAVSIDGVIRGASGAIVTANNIYVARSDTNDPTGDWDGVRFVADTVGALEFHDYPTLGLDADGLYICTQDFDGGGNESCYSIPKADLLLATPSIANLTRFEATPPGLPRVDGSLQPALDFGLTDGRAALLGSTGTALVRSDIFGAGFAGATLGAPVPITGDPGHQPPPPARQRHPFDPTVTIENVAPRFVGNVVKQGDSLWAVHAVLGNFNNSALRWYEIDEVTNTVRQTGLIEDPNQDFHEPSIAVNAFDHVAIGYTCSGPNLAASACVSVGETVSGVTTFERPQILAIGAGHYYRDFCTPTPANPCAERNRWGDYSATVIDPVDPCTLWTFQEFVAVSAVGNVGPGRAEGGNWGTRVTELTFKSCAVGDVRVFKDCKPDKSVPTGEPATCTILVENLGPGPALGVEAVDRFLSNGTFEFGAITTTVGICTATPNPQKQQGEVHCDLGKLAARETVTIKIPVAADKPQDINDRVIVDSDSPDPNPTNNVAEDSVRVEKD
jgi:Domain of unknown function DUF11